ncbi:SAVMC3_10250 family protein [Streptomyces griseoluteus]|uniref:SAVMC3_10250 family protein n=1 Tax=Streptomyces griseoluteus TaxID=29306 RepID=UPI00380B99F9
MALREFIYLSDAKLRQFIPPARRLRRPGALRLTTPVGGIDLDAPAGDADSARGRQLDQVVGHLAETARWFGEPDLRPGGWVWFEAPLLYFTLRDADRDLVLFTDPAPGADPEYPAPDCRLLLHGSVRHLLGVIPVPVEDASLVEHGGGGDSAGTPFITAAGHVVRALTGTDTPAPPGAQGVRDLLDALDGLQPDLPTAPRTRGYARVTASLPATATAPRCLVASPLTVEYAP